MSEQERSEPPNAASAFLADGNAVLLVRRGKEPALGLWSLPGGSLEPGESPEAGVVRELREECSLELADLCLLTTVARTGWGQDGAARTYRIAVFSGRVVGGQLQASSDASEARWVPLSELPRYKLTEGLMETISALSRCLAMATPGEKSL